MPGPTRWRRLATALLAIAALALPSVAAQADMGPMTLGIAGLPSRPIAPETESQSFEAVVEIPCGTAVTASLPNSNLVVGFEFAPPDGVVVTGPTALSVDVGPCLAAPPAAKLTASQRFNVTLLRTVPGLQELPVGATATLIPSGPLPSDPGEPATAAFTVVAAPYLRSEVTMDSKLQQCSCDEVTFAIEVANHGNVRTRYTFELGMAPSGEGWGVTMPDPIVLDRPAPGEATSQVVEVRMQMAGSNREGTAQVVIRSEADDDPAYKGESLTANMLGRKTPDGPVGVDAPLPLAIPLAALLGGAVLARRRA